MLADLIFENATVFDGQELLPDPVTIAIADGEILAVSSKPLPNLIGPDTRRRDMNGAFVMPGLVDVHNHHAVAGRAELFELKLPLGASCDEILAAVEAYAAELPEGAWITGGPWGTNLLAELHTLDMLAKLDRAAGGRPVILIEDSRHNRWVSSETMRRAGILGGPHANDEGVLVDRKTGAPTGVLLESAGLLAEHALAEEGGVSEAQHRAASQHGVEVLNSFGITAFQDAAASLPILQALKSLDDAEELNAWVVSSLTINDDIFGFSPIGQALIDVAEPYRSHQHRPNFVKIFLDGVPPARTAAFLEPYLPDEAHGHDFAGTLTIPYDEFSDLLQQLAAQGFGVKVHCAGDASARAVLDATERLRASGDTETRVHIAHGQILDEADVPRLSRLGVTADMSPFIWFPGIIPTALTEVLPAHVAARVQPTRDLLDDGALLAMGSDWPVSPTPNPWVGIHGLVTRADPFRSTPGTLWPEQALTLTEALRICTANGAEAMGLGGITGRIAAGFSADLIVLDRNPFAHEALGLVDTGVSETWFRGRAVHRSND